MRSYVRERTRARVWVCMYARVCGYVSVSCIACVRICMTCIVHLKVARMHVCHVRCVMHGKRGLRAWRACVACVRNMHAWLACVVWVQFVRGLHACVRTYGACVSGVQACVCVPSFSITSIPLQPLNPHARYAYTHTHAHTHEHKHTHTRTYSHTRPHAKNLFSRTFCTSREYGDYGYFKIKGMANTWRAISRLQIDEIEKIQRGFQEYDFDFKISNRATRITCSTSFC